MLNVVIMSVIILNVANNPFMLRIILLIFVMLNVVMLSVEAPSTLLTNFRLEWK